MNIINFLNNNLFSKILEISLNIYQCSCHTSDSFYDNVDEKDVEFLKKEALLSNETSKTKMIVFHIALKNILLILFKEYFKKNKTPVIFSYNNLIKENELISIDKIEFLLKNIIEKLNKNQIKIILKTLYVDLTCLVSRKNTGTEFTPDEIVEYMLNSINYSGKETLEKKLLDPSCGSGIYIVKALKILINNLKKDDINKTLLEKKLLIAYDINPINIMITKFLMIIEIFEAKKEFMDNEISDLYLNLPVYCKDILFEEGKYDFIIGNPPYIRLQNIPEKQRENIKFLFESTTGRYDMYVCFMEKLINLLNIDGKISLITSNKYMTANYGKGIRHYIKKNLEVFEIFDLGDTKYFKASILPAIITGTKKENPLNININYAHIKQDNSKISEENNSKPLYLKELFEIHQKEFNIKKYYHLKKEDETIKIEFVKSIEKFPEKNLAWNFGDKDDIEIKTYIEKQNTIILKELAEVCVGIKTTVDNLYVKPMTSDFIKEKNFEKEIIYPLLQSHNIKKWNITWNETNKNDRYIFYPHILKNKKMCAIDLESLPNAKNYIYENQDILKSRKYLNESPTRKWYECWVPQNLEKFKKIKIITADITSSNSFAIDYTGKLCQGNTFFISLKDDNNIVNLFENKNYDTNYRNNNTENYWLYLLAILNSEVLEFYQKSISGSLYSKKFRYTTTNLNQWPIPTITESNIQLVEDIIDLVKKIDKFYPKIKNLEIQLQNKIFTLYNISENYKCRIKKFLDVNS